MVSLIFGELNCYKLEHSFWNCCNCVCWKVGIHNWV